MSARATYLTASGVYDASKKWIILTVGQRKSADYGIRDDLGALVHKPRYLILAIFLSWQSSLELGQLRKSLPYSQNPYLNSATNQDASLQALSRQNSAVDPDSYSMVIVTVSKLFIPP